MEEGDLNPQYPRTLLCALASPPSIKRGSYVHIHHRRVRRSHWRTPMRAGALPTLHPQRSELQVGTQ